MPTFYIELDVAGVTSQDDEGFEFDKLDEAKAEARNALVETVREYLRVGDDYIATATVSDARRNILFIERVVVSCMLLTERASLKLKFR